VDSSDGHHASVQKRSYAETYTSIPPIHHEQAGNLMRTGQSSIASASRPMFTKNFPRNCHPSDWLPNSPTANLAPSPVPWMLTKNPNNQGGQVVMSSLNDNFGRVDTGCWGGRAMGGWDIFVCWPHILPPHKKSAL